MKLFVAALLLACVGATIAMVMPTKMTPVHQVGSEGLDNCDFKCPKQDLLICAKNGQCMQTFMGQCSLSAYNCKHPQKPFQNVENWRCEQNGAPLCGAEDRMELGL